MRERERGGLQVQLSRELSDGYLGVVYERVY